MGRGRIDSSQSLKKNTSLLELQILVVDDDSISLATVSSMLKTCSLQDHLVNLSVVTVKNSIDALSTIRTKNGVFDLVITDLHLPGMNGWELQKQVDEEFKIPVIFMSLDNKESAILKSLESGAIFHMMKPVNEQDLNNIWQYAVSSKKGKAVVTDPEMNNNIEEGTASSNDQDVNSASSVNEDSNKKKKGRKRSRDDHDEDAPSAPKKAKVVWTNSLHTRFLQAINYIGLEKAVPKRILEFMNVPGLTRENVASHLQKYRMFLKKVAERGFWSSQTLSERALRSSFATGYSSMMFKNHHQQYPPQPLRTFQAGCGGNYYGPSCSSYGFPRHPSQEASSVNSAPPQFRYGQTGLFGNSSFQRPLMFGNTNPFYHPNQTRFGMQPNNGSNGFPTATTPMTMYQQPNQAAGSQFQSIGSPLPTYNFQFCSSSSSANMETMNNSFSPFNPNSNYAGIRLNSNGELGTGQVGFNGNELSTGFNVGSGSLNWTNNITTNSNNNLNNAPTTAANGILGCVPPQGGFSSSSSSTGFGNFLAQGESSASSILFGNANQFSPPPPFTAGNHECTLVLPPLSHQNTSAVLQNSGGGIDFSFNNITNDADSDNQQELEDSDLELFFGSNHCTTPPYQQQGIEGVLNLGSPYQAELSSTVNELLNVEFSNSCSLADKAPWNEQSSALQFQVAEETVNANFGGSALAGNDYLPNLVQPQRNPGAGEPVDSELNGMHQETATSDENQVWEDDFLDLLLGNEPY